MCVFFAKRIYALLNPWWSAQTQKTGLKGFFTRWWPPWHCMVLHEIVFWMIFYGRTCPVLYAITWYCMVVWYPLILHGPDFHWHWCWAGWILKKLLVDLYRHTLDKRASDEANKWRAVHPDSFCPHGYVSAFSHFTVSWRKCRSRSKSWCRF